MTANPDDMLDPTAAAYAAWGEWFDAIAVLLEGDTDEVDIQTWTEWYAKGMPPASAAARYRRFHTPAPGTDPSPSDQQP